MNKQAKTISIVFLIVIFFSIGGYYLIKEKKLWATKKIQEIHQDESLITEISFTKEETTTVQSDSKAKEPEASETIDGFKKFTDKNKNYSLLYPSSWHIDTTEDWKDPMYKYSLVDLGSTSNPRENSEIRITMQPGVSGFDTVESKQEDLAAIGQVRKITPTKINLGGKMTTVYIDIHASPAQPPHLDSGTDLFYIFANGIDTYTIMLFSNNNKEFEERLPVFKDLLASFKVL